MEDVRDLLWPGITAWQRKGLFVDDFYVRDNALYVRTRLGVDHLIATAAEIEDGSYKEFFGPRMQELTLISQPIREASR